MKWMVAVLLLWTVSCRGSGEVWRSRGGMPSSSVRVPVYENTWGLPIAPGYRLGGVSREVDVEESELSRVIGRISDKAIWISGVLLALTLVLVVVASKVPGAGHLAAFCGLGSAVMLVLGVFASWIIYGLGFGLVLGLGYGIYVAVSADRRKQARDRLDKALGEVVSSMELVKGASVEDWERGDSQVRREVDRIQSSMTKQLVSQKKRGKAHE